MRDPRDRDVAKGMWQRLQGKDALSFVAVMLFCVMGYFGAPLWMAFVGGALFGVPSMIELMLLKQRHPAVPTDWRIVWFYAGAIGNGVCAALAGFFMGYGWRAYFFPA